MLGGVCRWAAAGGGAVVVRVRGRAGRARSCGGAPGAAALPQGRLAAGGAGATTDPVGGRRGAQHDIISIYFFRKTYKRV